MRLLRVTSVLLICCSPLAFVVCGTFLQVGLCMSIEYAAHLFTCSAKCRMATVPNYTLIAKGRGFVYVHSNQLYRQVKKKGEVRYLKCCVPACDGSAKIECGDFVLGVSVYRYMVLRIYFMYFHVFSPVHVHGSWSTHTNWYYNLLHLSERKCTHYV